MLIPILEQLVHLPQRERIHIVVLPSGDGDDVAVDLAPIRYTGAPGNPAFGLLGGDESLPSREPNSLVTGKLTGNFFCRARKPAWIAAF